jgi:general secretion pathway protein K
MREIDGARNGRDGAQPRGGSRAQRPDGRCARRAQSGAAIITVMLVVALVTVVVTALFWRSHVTVRSVENRLAMSQANWIQRVAIDWFRVMLMVDRRMPGALGNVDHLAEPWAAGLQPTEVDETVFAGANVRSREGRVATLSGWADDAQGRLNLTNLIDDPNGVWLEAFKRLLAQTGQSESLAVALRHRLRQSATRTVDGKPVAAQAGYYPFLRSRDLLRVPGFDASVIAAIDLYVVFLPIATPVNLNTCRPEVLAAVLEDMDVGTARNFAGPQATRLHTTLADAQRSLNYRDPLPPEVFSVNSSFFIVNGVIRYERIEALTQTLIQRQGNKVEVIWQYRS